MKFNRKCWIELIQDHWVFILLCYYYVRFFHADELFSWVCGSHIMHLLQLTMIILAFCVTNCTEFAFKPCCWFVCCICWVLFKEYLNILNIIKFRSERNLLFLLFVVKKVICSSRCVFSFKNAHRSICKLVFTLKSYSILGVCCSILR